MMNKYEIAVYYFPNFHVDPRNELVHGAGWSEWELVKEAKPRFSGHQQPKVPLTGYEDEANPQVFARKIHAAAEHGVTNFIFDWYWYNDGPFLNRALDEGFMKAQNNHRINFSLMWANHDWIDIHPARLNQTPKLLYPGAVTKETFETITDYIIENYFSYPSYWRIDGRPYFSIYEVSRLVEGLGGIDETRNALDAFRAKTRAAGFDDLHLNAIVRGVQPLPGEQKIKNPNELLAALNIDSVTSYAWVHHVPLTDFPTTDYHDVAAKAVKYWYQARDEFNLPYFPNVTMGWDPTPRTNPADPFENKGYPFSAILTNNTPSAFKQALRSAKRFLDEQKSGPRIFTINAWNEWTEGSYLEPDTVNKWGYLEAIKEVFGKEV